MEMEPLEQNFTFKNKREIMNNLKENMDYKYNFDNNNNINIMKNNYYIETNEKKINNSNLRKMNNLLSKQNKLIKGKIQKLEQETKNINFNDESIYSMKNEIKKVINKNNSLNYMILNDVKDIYTLRNNIVKLKILYNKMILPKLNFENFILNNTKEELELKILELNNKKNNLEILYNSGLRKKKNNEEIKYKLNKIIESINYKNNYINDDKEAYKIIDKLLNEKQKLIEENINAINSIENKNGNHIIKHNNVKEEELSLLKNNNEKLNNKLNKYNIIINKIKMFLNNSNYKGDIETRMNLDKNLTKAIEKNAKINNEIENIINKYKNEVEKKEKIIDELKSQYRKSKKDDITSIDNFIL